MIHPDDGFGHWLAGFIDGEGCFFFHERKKQMSTPQFQIKLRDDDKEILSECVTRTGIGRLIAIPRADASKPQCKWLVSKRSECISLVVILDAFPLRAKKRRDFEIWRKAVLLWADQRRVGKAGGGTERYSGGDEMVLLQEQLTRGRTYVS